MEAMNPRLWSTRVFITSALVCLLFFTLTTHLSLSATVTSTITPGTADWAVCGEGMCKCKGHFADCSRTGLRFIPRFPAKITALDFSYNEHIRVARSFTVYDSLLQNISHFTYLDLSENFLKGVVFRNDSFQAFKNLTTFKYNSNQCGDCLFPALYAVETLTHLEMFGVKLYHKPNFERFPRISKSEQKSSFPGIICTSCVCRNLLFILLF
jgi:hypothetical protein